jgi:hypothetical protein
MINIQPSFVNTSLTETGRGPRLQRARERVLRGMSDAELDAKLKELETELDSRKPTFDIQFS